MENNCPEIDDAMSPESNLVQAETDQSSNPQPKLIVVLEDDQDIMRVLTLILSTDGYQVEPYGTVKEFYELANQTKANLFLLDIALPDGNGLEVCKQLKENPQTADTPVVLMSAHTHHLIGTGRQDDFITKPFNILDFRNKIKRYA